MPKNGRKYPEKIGLGEIKKNIVAMQLCGRNEG